MEVLPVHANVRVATALHQQKARIKRTRPQHLQIEEVKRRRIRRKVNMKAIQVKVTVPRKVAMIMLRRV